MKQILIPCDLGVMSDHAYSIASVLAEKLNADITLLSIIHGPSEAFYNENGSIKENNSLDLSEWIEKKKLRIEELNNWAENKDRITRFIVEIGRVNDLIISYTESNNIDLIVMGTEGLFGFDEFLKHSHTQYIVNHSHTPVLSLKCDRSNVNLNELVLVSDFHEIKELPLTCVKSIAKAFDSKVVLLKINTPKEKETKEETLYNMKEFVSINHIENVEFCIYSDDSIEQGVSKFCMERHIDLISIGTHQKSGISKLFKGSVSDSFVNHLFHPVLTFPIK